MSRLHKKISFLGLIILLPLFAGSTWGQNTPKRTGPVNNSSWGALIGGAPSSTSGSSSSYGSGVDFSPNTKLVTASGCKTTSHAPPMWKDYAAYLAKDSQTIRDYNSTGVPNPDNRSDILGGEGEACPGQTSLVCEDDTALHCVPYSVYLQIRDQINNGGRISIKDKKDKKDKRVRTAANPTDGCLWGNARMVDGVLTSIDGNGAVLIPTQNMVQMEKFQHDPKLCGFALGAGRLPCAYTWQFSYPEGENAKNILNDIVRNQNNVRASASRYTNYKGSLYNNSGLNPDQPASPTDSTVEQWKNGKDQGTKFKYDMCWPDGEFSQPLPGEVIQQPETKTPVAAKPTVPDNPPVQKTACDRSWDEKSDCTEWSGCLQEVMTKQLTECNASACTLQQCSTNYEAIAQVFDSPIGRNVDKSQFFQDNNIDSRAKEMTDAVNAFENVMDHKNSFYGADPARCFFYRLQNVTSNVAAISPTCKTDGSTLSLGGGDSKDGVTADLTAITSDKPMPKYTEELDRMNKTDFKVLNDFARARIQGYQASGVNQNSGLFAKFIEKAGTMTEDQKAATLTLLKAISHLTYDAHRASFLDLVSKPENTKYFTVGATTPFSTSKFLDQVKQIEARDSSLDRTSCIQLPQGTTNYDAYANKFKNEVVTMRSLMNLEQTCHPTPKAPLTCPAGYDKEFHCKGEDTSQH